MKKLITKKW